MMRPFSLVGQSVAVLTGALLVTSLAASPRPSGQASATLNITADSGGLRIEPTAQLLQLMRTRESLRLEAVSLSDGRLVDLDLEPVQLRSPRVRLRSSDGVTMTTLPSPDVRAFSGTIDGSPDSRAFIGWDGHRLHGWIQSDTGLDVISSTPGDPNTWMHRPASGGKPAPTHRVEAASGPADPGNEYARLLDSLSSDELKGRVQLDAQLIGDCRNWAAAVWRRATASSSRKICAAIFARTPRQ